MHQACAADDEILAKLPTFGPPPQTWEDCMASGKYELLSCSAEDRAAGEYHSAPVLHVPSNIMCFINNVICNVCIVDAMGTPAISHVTWLSHL